MDLSNNVCKLECVDQNVHEFVGPVKIVFVKPSNLENFRRGMLSSCMFVSSLALGATLMMVIWFSLFFLKPIYNNAHIFLCTLGGQLFMPIAILVVNNKHFGPAMHLEQGSRRCQHILMQLIGVGLCIAGGASLFLLDRKGKISHSDFGSLHILTGCITVALPALSGFSGFILLLRRSEKATPGVVTVCHRTVGIITFISSSVCFITGVMKPIFILWGGPHLPLLLSGFCAFYTVIILFVPCTSCCCS